MRRAFAINKTWVTQERAFLEQIPIGENKLTSGEYVIEMRIPNTPVITYIVQVVVESDGTLTFPGRKTNTRNGIEETFTQSGGIVSWYDEGALYSGNAEYIGIIDGDTIWGHVFGFNPDEGAVGVWRMDKM